MLDKFGKEITQLYSLRSSRTGAVTRSGDGHVFSCPYFHAPGSSATPHGVIVWSSGSLQDGHICSMQKGGKEPLTKDDILFAVNLAVTKTKELVEHL